MLSASGDNTIGIWDLKSGNLISKLNGHTGCVSSIDISLDGEICVSGGGDNKVFVWDLIAAVPITIFRLNFFIR